MSVKIKLGIKKIYVDDDVFQLGECRLNLLFEKI